MVNSTVARSQHHNTVIALTPSVPLKVIYAIFLACKVGMTYLGYTEEQIAHVYSDYGELIFELLRDPRLGGCMCAALLIMSKNFYSLMTSNTKQKRQQPEPEKNKGDECSPPLIGVKEYNDYLDNFLRQLDEIPERPANIKVATKKQMKKELPRKTTECRADQVRNPDTGRWVLKTGTIGKRILAARWSEEDSSSGEEDSGEEDSGGEVIV